MYKSSNEGGGRSMKRERISDSNSPPPATSTSTSASMSKRSRVNTSSSRYSNNNDNDSNSDNDNNGGGGVGGGVSPKGRQSQGGRGSGSTGRGYNSSYESGGGYGGRGSRGGGSGGGSSRDGHHHSSSSSHHNRHSTSSSSSSYPYKVLCMTKLHQKASDDFIRDSLLKEFRRYGNISVKVVHEPDERVAYVYFRSAEDAREVKHSKQAIYIYDRAVKIEAAYESSTSAAPVVPAVPQHGGYGGRDNRGDPYGDASGGGGRGGYGSGSASSRRSPPPGGGGGGDYRDHHHHHHSRGGYDSRPPGGPPYGGHYGRDYRGGGRDMDYGGNSRMPYGGRSYPPSGGPPPPLPPHHSVGGPPHHHHPGGPPPHHQHHHHQPPPLHHQQPPPMGRSGSSSSSMPPPPGGPPHHHPPPIPGGGPPPHGDFGVYPPGGGPPGPPGGRYENKKDKFPNYLQHVNPEEDPLATRTLFAGNLEVNITDEELRRIFGRYGVVEDIDIKRPPPGTGNAYAFVRFVNLDMSARAKSELSGQYIGKFQCKIGYGKMNPTTKIWIGGLGSWTTLQMLEREFDRFGSIKKIDWAKGEPFAYITYETIDAAQAAVKDMRGYPLGGTDKRLRTDFADASAPPVGSISYKPYDYNTGGPPPPHHHPEGGGGGGGDSNIHDEKYNNGRSPRPPSASTPVGGSGTPPHPHHSGDHHHNIHSPATSDTEIESHRSMNGNSSSGSLTSSRSITDIGKRGVMGWQGGLILKNSSFPTKFYLTDGDLEGIESLLKDEEGKAQLRITQRLRLDQAKLDDVSKRIQTAPSFAIFLSLPSSSQATSTLSSPSSDNNNTSSSSTQSRPLRNLVSYLKQKEAAGVISLTSGADTTSTGVLYAFPPCQYSWELLKRTCPNVSEGLVDVSGKEDHLVVVVIRGGGTTTTASTTANTNNNNSA